MRKHPTDEATFARSNGKLAVAARIVWQLNVLGSRLRCLSQENENEFVVEAYVEGKWGTEIARGESAAVLLKRAALVIANRMETK